MMPGAFARPPSPDNRESARDLTPPRVCHQEATGETRAAKETTVILRAETRPQCLSDRTVGSIATPHGKELDQLHFELPYVESNERPVGDPPRDDMLGETTPPHAGLDDLELCRDIGHGPPEPALEDVHRLRQLSSRAVSQDDLRVLTQQRAGHGTAGTSEDVVMPHDRDDAHVSKALNHRGAKVHRLSARDHEIGLGVA